MSSKVILAAVAVVALQALLVQASSIGVAGDDADLALNITLPTPSFDFGAGNAIVQALRNIIDGIVAQINTTYQAYAKAINGALAATTNTTTTVLAAWNDYAYNMINSFDAIASVGDESNVTVTSCLAKQPSIRSVSEALYGDVSTCDSTLYANITAATKTLENVENEAVALVDDIRKAFQDCQPSGWLAISCFAAKSPQFFTQAAGLALDATRAAGDIDRELPSIPQKFVECSDAAVQKRTAEVKAIEDAVLKCLEQNLSTSTNPK